eukprot:SAG31_NODE_6181_length_2134_cov_6.611302_2_plen_319_part_01
MYSNAVYEEDGQFVGIAYAQQSSMPHWDGQYVSSCLEVDFGGPVEGLGVKIVAAASDEVVCGVSCVGEYCGTSGAMHIFAGASSARDYSTFAWQATVQLPMDSAPGDRRHGEMMDTVVLFPEPVPVRWVAFCRSGAGGARDQLVMDFAALVVNSDQNCPSSLPPPSTVRSGALELYYSFDAQSAIDESGNRRNGEWQGTESYVLAQDPAGRHGGFAASFDGSSRIVIPAFAGMEWGDRLTVSLHFKRTGGEGNYQGILNNGYYDNGSFEIRMGREGGGTMLGGGVITAGHAEAWDHVQLRAEMQNWHHVAMIYDGQEVQ